MFEKEMILERLSMRHFVDPLLDKFIRYVKIETTSNSEEKNKKPSFDGELDLARVLIKELNDIGCDNIVFDDNGFVIATIGATPGFEKCEPILFSAHMDTSDACSGKDVKPQIIQDYDGSIITLSEGRTIDPKTSIELKNCIHDTIITSDGTTLLGADDKAGCAIIMTAIEHIKNQNINHGTIQIMFSCDEEIGRGMDYVPLDKIIAKNAYTIDGSGAPEINYECFDAYFSTITFYGKSVHPGYSRGMMVNSLTMAAQFITMIPRTESPEATDNRYGFFHVVSCEGDVEKTVVKLIIRDFQDEAAQERCERVRSIAKAIESIFPGGRVDTVFNHQYSNMLHNIGDNNPVIEYLKKAAIDICGKPKILPIRGGTDGARLTSLGIATPNIFTGSFNFHSRTEVASVSQMVASTQLVIKLVELWSQNK